MMLEIYVASGIMVQGYDTEHALHLIQVKPKDLFTPSESGSKGEKG